jgi:hypothetical protein
MVHLAAGALGGRGQRRRGIRRRERQIEIFDGAGKLLNTWRDESCWGA